MPPPCLPPKPGQRAGTALDCRLLSLHVCPLLCPLRIVPFTLGRGSHACNTLDWCVISLDVLLLVLATSRHESGAARDNAAACTTRVHLSAPGVAFVALSIQPCSRVASNSRFQQYLTLPHPSCRFARTQKAPRLAHGRTRAGLGLRVSVADSAALDLCHPSAGSLSASCVVLASSSSPPLAVRSGRPGWSLYGPSGWLSTSSR